MNKITIIGANSYIARNLIFYLKDKDVNISMYGHSAKHIDGGNSYECVDILDKNNLSKIDFDCDYIYFFSARTGTSIGFESYNEFVHVNELGLLNILDEYVKQKSKAKIIFPSTRLVYKGKNCPLKENDEKEFKTIYAINKYSCEQYLSMYALMFGIRYCVVRICVPYGTMIENARSYGTIDFFLTKARSKENITLYGTGEQRRSIIDIRDLCRILFDVAKSDCNNDIYNIGGENYSLKEMAMLIAEKYEVLVDYIPFPEKALILESGSTVFDDSKLKQKLGDSLYKYNFAYWVKDLIV